VNLILNNFKFLKILFLITSFGYILSEIHCNVNKVVVRTNLYINQRINLMYYKILL